MSITAPEIQAPQDAAENGHTNGEISAEQQAVVENMAAFVVTRLHSGQQVPLGPDGTPRHSDNIHGHRNGSPFAGEDPYHYTGEVAD